MEIIVCFEGKQTDSHISLLWGKANITVTYCWLWGKANMTVTNGLGATCVLNLKHNNISTNNKCHIVMLRVGRTENTLWNMAAVMDCGWKSVFGGWSFRGIHLLNWAIRSSA